MDELKTMDSELTTADLAKNGAPKQLNGPRLVKGYELEGLDRAAATSEYVPLFSESEMGDFSVAMDQDTDLFRRRATRNGQRRRQACRSGDAATC